jgi:hypothetical protein
MRVCEIWCGLCTGMDKLSGLLEEERWSIILVDNLFLFFAHIEGIVMGVGKEVDKVAHVLAIWR